MPLGLVGDIGSTNARFGLVDLETGALTDIGRTACAEHPSLQSAAAAYLRRTSARPTVAALAVAGPVRIEPIRFVNLPWSFTREELRRDLDLTRVTLLNDFEALALSVEHLRPEELRRIGGAEPLPGAARALVGPGTGLGVAGLVRTDGRWLPLPSEGGHASLAVEDEVEFAILRRIAERTGHVSAERVLSGPGLVALYQALAGLRGADAASLGAPQIVAAGLAGADPLCGEALDRFVTFLGRFAGDAALFLGAQGGLYLGGGIAPKIVDRLQSGPFRAAFEAKGRMAAYLAPIPIYVILPDFVALRGAAAALTEARG